MKNSDSSQQSTKQRQAKGSRQNPESRENDREGVPAKDASSSQRAEKAAKGGQPLSADKQSERSPKQENL